jgi:ketosteroid isomerase-like protein
MARKSEVRPARKAPKGTAKSATPTPARRKAATRPPLAGAVPAAKPKARARKSTVAAAPAAPSSAETLARLEALNRRYYDAFQSLDIEELGRIWWHDEAACCIHPGWDARHGWPAVRGSFEEIFANTKSIRFALGDVRSRVVGDIGYVCCVENLVSEEGESGDYLGAVLATNVFERRRGEWRLVHHHASPFSSDEADLPEGPLH